MTTPSRSSRRRASLADARPISGRIARAYLQVLLAGSLWATSGPFSILLHRMGVPPTSVALLRPAAGALFLGVLLWAFRHKRPSPQRGSLTGMLLGGGVIVGVFQTAYQMSTQAIGVPATVALLYLAPAIVLVLSAVLFGERLTPAKGALALVSVAGVWLTVVGARGADVSLTPAGVAWGGLCGLGYACYTVFGKYFSPREGPLAALTWSTIGGTMLLMLLWTIAGEPIVLPPTPSAWGVLLLFGFLTIAASALLLFNGLRTLEAGRASIATTIEPLVATLLAIALLSQSLTALGWTGLLLLTAGVAGAYALPSRGVGVSGRAPADLSGPS